MKSEERKVNQLEQQTLDFAAEILILVKSLQNDNERIISGQIGRSATSIGANVREAAFASSKADFVSKMHIALKESNETKYWLDLLLKTDYLAKTKYDTLIGMNNSIHFMLISSINTAKNSLNEKQ